MHAIAVFDGFYYSLIFQQDDNSFYRFSGDLPKFVSYFESEDWDGVIEFGKDIVRRQYQAHIITNGLE
jgi:hypothetical protein